METKNTHYNLLDPVDAPIATYTVSEDEEYARFFQLTTIMGMTTSERELLITKVDTSLLACLDSISVFYDKDAPVKMSTEEILVYIGFAVQEKSEVRM